MKCPNCGLENPDSTLKCDCGYNFVKKEIVSKLEENIEKPKIQNGNNIDFLSFDKMISDKLIKILYIIGLIVINISGFILLINGFKDKEIRLIFIAIICYTFVNLIWRIICENMIIFFKIFEKINEIEKKI